jgi:hypothetical protein
MLKGNVCVQQYKQPPSRIAVATNNSFKPSLIQTLLAENPGFNEGALRRISLASNYCKYRQYIFKKPNTVLTYTPIACSFSPPTKTTNPDNTMSYKNSWDNIEPAPGKI